MIDFKQYDSGVANHISKLKLNRLPLYSWDFYGDFYQILSGNISDLNKLNLLGVENKWLFETELTKELDADTVILVTDAAINIVFSTRNIIRMTGYHHSEVLGKSPKIFQGQDTSKEISLEIRSAINSNKPFEKTIVNYRKDGTPYECHIKGFPIFNSRGHLSHFIAFEKAA